jgi:aryl-alcohol dehydrogenase-like predicted oxidoreductase
MGAIKRLIEAGYVRYAGLSEVGVETIRRANETYRISELQIEYSLMSRSIERAILPAMREMGITITAYGILSRGLLAGKTTATMTPGDYRSHLPRWQGENEARNLQMVAALKAIADELGATTSQLALAWVRARAPEIVPLTGARTRAQLDDALRALDLRLSEDDLERIEAAVPADEVAGTRYDKNQMAVLDSERV